MTPISNPDSRAVVVTLVLALSIIVVIPAFSSPAAAAETHHSEDFEGYTNGTDITTEDWEEVPWSDGGTSVIHDGHANNGAQSLYLNSTGTGNNVEVRPNSMPFSENTTGDITWAFKIDTTAAQMHAYEGSTVDENGRVIDIEVGGGPELRYVNQSGTRKTLSTSIQKGEWIEITVTDIDPSTNSATVIWESPSDSGEATIETGSEDMQNGYDQVTLRTDGTAYYDDVVVDASVIKGQVVDGDGDPADNVTVYAAGYDAKNPPTIDGTPFDEIANDPLPDGWDNQVNQDWADRGQIDVDGTELDGTRVLMHTRDQWNLEGHVDIGGRQLMAQADLSPPRATVSPDDDVVLSCWDTQPSSRDAIFEDNVGASLPGAVVDSCNGIVVEKIDPTGDVEQKSTFNPQTEIVVGIQTFDSTSTTYEAVFPSLGEGVYKVYPEGSQENAIYYAVAPNGDVNVLESEIENWASDRSESISQYNEELKAEYDAGNLEFVSTTTNETGYYTLDVPNQATAAEVRAVKDGGVSTVDPQNLSRTDIRDEIDSSVRTNFNEEYPNQNFRDIEPGGDIFQKVCQRMDPVAEDVGVPFYGETSTDIPNPKADIEGQYLLPDDLDPKTKLCAAYSLASSLLNDVGDFLDPGLADDLSDLSDEELRQLLSQVQSLIENNDALCEEFANQVEASSCDEALEDPEDLSRDELEDRVSDGYNVVDDTSDHAPNGGGGGGGLIGGDDSVNVDDGETTIGNQTFSHEWPVGGVSNWNDAEIMIRLTWSNGSTTVLDDSSEYVEIDESLVGSDTVKITDYPIGDQDPAALQARIDVVTQDSVGSGESEPVKNPTWSGDLPRVNSVKVSKWFPGDDDTFSVSVTPADEARFGSLERVEVTEPDGTVSTYQPEDGSVDAKTNGVGDHRVAVVFSAGDDNATEFTEVVNVRASETTRDRPPSIRGQSGAIGRYAVVGHGLSEGEIEVEKGASEITMTAVIPQDAETPKSITADTTGLSTDADSTTTIRVRRGSSRQTIRERIGIVLHAPEIGEDALVWRNGDAITRDGTQWGVVNVDNGTSVDTISNERGEVKIRVDADPSRFDRVRHWLDANFNFSLPFGMVSDPTLLMVIGALAARRRRGPPGQTSPPSPGNCGQQTAHEA